MGTIIEQSRVAREIGDGHGSTGSGYTPKFFTSGVGSTTLTLKAYERVLIATAAGGFALTVTLPTAESVPGAVYYIRATGAAANTTVNSTSGSTTTAMAVLTNANDWVCVMSVGLEYIRLASVIGGVYA